MDARIAWARKAQEEVAPEGEEQTFIYAEASDDLEVCLRVRGFGKEPKGFVVKVATSYASHPKGKVAEWVRENPAERVLFAPLDAEGTLTAVVRLNAEGSKGANEERSKDSKAKQTKGSWRCRRLTLTLSCDRVAVTTALVVIPPKQRWIGRLLGASLGVLLVVVLTKAAEFASKTLLATAPELGATAGTAVVAWLATQFGDARLPRGGLLLRARPSALLAAAFLSLLAVPSCMFKRVKNLSSIDAHVDHVHLPPKEWQTIPFWEYEKIGKALNDKDPGLEHLARVTDPDGQGVFASVLGPFLPEAVVLDCKHRNAPIARDGGLLCTKKVADDCVTLLDDATVKVPPVLSSACHVPAHGVLAVRAVIPYPPRPFTDAGVPDAGVDVNEDCAGLPSDAGAPRFDVPHIDATSLSVHSFHWEARCAAAELAAHGGLTSFEATAAGGKPAAIPLVSECGDAADAAAKIWQVHVRDAQARVDVGTLALACRVGSPSAGAELRGIRSDRALELVDSTADDTPKNACTEVTYVPAVAAYPGYLARDGWLLTSPGEVRARVVFKTPPDEAVVGIEIGPSANSTRAGVQTDGGPPGAQVEPSAADSGAPPQTTVMLTFDLETNGKTTCVVPLGADGAQVKLSRYELPEVPDTGVFHVGEIECRNGATTWTPSRGDRTYAYLCEAGSSCFIAVPGNGNSKTHAEVKVHGHFLDYTRITCPSACPNPKHLVDAAAGSGCPKVCL